MELAAQLNARDVGQTQTFMTSCPVCRSSLEPGFVELRNTWLDFFVVGWSHLILSFSDGENFEYDVLEPTKRHDAFGCANCQSVVITNRLSAP